MSFRFKMFVLFPLVVVAAVAVVAIGVTVSTRRAFEQLDNQHTEAIVHIEPVQSRWDRG